MFFIDRFYGGGAPFSSTISAVKTEKIKKIFFFTVFPGGGTPFSSTISAVKTVKIEHFLFYRFYRGGRPFFVLFAVKTVKHRIVFYRGGAPLFFLPYPR